MFSREFFYWCRDAISRIKYKPDRDKVYRELYEHLEDRYDSFIAKGMSHEEAEKKTLEAMGDPMELAPQLAAIHKPHWAYAAIVTRVIVCALCCICLVKGIDYFLGSGFYTRVDDVWDPFEHGGDQCIAHVEPDASVRSDGYTFSVEEAALWRTFYSESVNGEEYFDSLYICLRVTHPLPWMREQQAVHCMWAVDSNGTYYESFAQACGELPRIVYNTRHASGLGTYEYELSFQDISEDMQWIELHYDRDGRDLVLRIELTGGEG